MTELLAVAASIHQELEVFHLTNELFVGGNALLPDHPI
jgi:hypothetical protein